MEMRIIDGMEKEGIALRNIMIFGYILSIIIPLGTYLAVKDEYTNNEYLLMTLFFIFIGSYGLYGWLYAIKYRIIITDEVVTLKTTFKYTEIQLVEINGYTYKRYMKTDFYQFKLFNKDKTVLINTRYKNEFIEILNNKGISARK